MAGQARHAYHMAGGLHHAFPDRGSGFCVYNDAAIAIAHIRKQYGARVLYIDTDVHHGDGVQWTFYADPDVCTYSIHETGKYLFPGTGFVHGTRDGRGFGTAINMPVEPYTEDDSWLESFRATVGTCSRSSSPTSSSASMAVTPMPTIRCRISIAACASTRKCPTIIHELAHQYADGRWIALGGGGYDIWRVVPRAWALVWLEMTDHPAVLRPIKRRRRDVPLPAHWMRQWAAAQPRRSLPDDWLDDHRRLGADPRRRANRRRATSGIDEYRHPDHL